MSSSTVIACPSCGKKNRVPASAQGLPRCAACKQALPWLSEADDTTFDAVVTTSPVPVLVDLWAPWCGPCRMVSPAVERMAAAYPGRLKVTKVNVDDSPRTAQRFQAMSIPTLLVMTEGQVTARQVGALPEPALADWVRRSVGVG
jgi:thioredoxin 2